MRLLEIVASAATDPTFVERAARIGAALGKGVVYGKDTPNFVANRIGVYGLLVTMQLMQSEGLTFEEVDAIVGKPMGRPASAAFGTADIVGLDTLAHVAQNCYDALPGDEEREVFKVPDLIATLLRQGRLGRKSGGGFFKKVGSEVRVLDLGSNEYRLQNAVGFESLAAAMQIEAPGERIKALVRFDDQAGRFAWKLTARTLAYAARRLGEISNDIVNIDRALRWGFNWARGPFEVWDTLGVKNALARMRRDKIAVPSWVDEMLASGRTSFYSGEVAAKAYWDVAAKRVKPVVEDPKVLALAAVKDDAKHVLKENLGAALVDIGDGCLCLEVHTKMNKANHSSTQPCSSRVMIHCRSVHSRVMTRLLVSCDWELRLGK